MREQHFPYLDKEKEWIGLEIPDIAFSLLFGIVAGFAVFALTNPILGLITAIIVSITTAIFIARRKRGKARGWFVRQLYFIFRLWNVVY